MIISISHFSRSLFWISSNERRHIFYFSY